MAAIPEGLSQNPKDSDVLASLLGTVRLSGSVQFCVLAAGDWQAEATEDFIRMLGAGAMPFHIVAEGQCWLRMDGQTTRLDAGDMILFPRPTPHQVGAGRDGLDIDIVADLPMPPWREIPVLRYGGDAPDARVICGFFQCDELTFPPLMHALPRLMHVRTGQGGWLESLIRRMVDEIDSPRAGAISVLPRLSEVAFVEILRNEISLSAPQSAGWLAALADPKLSRCLSLIHDDPRRDWSLETLASHAGLSRSALAQRFQDVLGTSPIRYVRDWRLHLASLDLARTQKSIIDIAVDAGYATEAAFTRAFARAFGDPPAAWRARVRASRA